MYHFAAHSRVDDWLFEDWHEAEQLWNGLAGLPGLRSMALMPDHVHTMLQSPRVQHFLDALRVYARRRNKRRGQPGGKLWLPVEPPTRIAGWKHLQRTVRYIHLNPCRDGLARDPLAWPFSTHRDSVGLALPAVVAPNEDPPSFHAYVSADSSVRVEGTDLPFGRRSMRDPSVEEVAAAVSALTRTPMGAVLERGAARTLLIQCLRTLTTASVANIARYVGVSVHTVRRASTVTDARVVVVERVLGDQRFGALSAGPLSDSWAWQRYRSSRERKGVNVLLDRRARQRKRRERAWAEFWRQVARDRAVLAPQEHR